MNRKKLALLYLVMGLSTQMIVRPAFAAKFKEELKMQNASAQKFSETTKPLVEKISHFGRLIKSAEKISAYSFSRKPSESNFSTVSQLNYAMGRLMSGDVSAKDLTLKTSKEIATFLLEAITEPEDEDVFDAAKSELTKAVEMLQLDRSLKIYGASHGEEDGVFQILNVLDENTKQILLIRVGFFGN